MKILSFDGLLPSMRSRYGWSSKIVILCRPSYVSLYNIIKDIIHKKTTNPPVILITGVSGIGKSLFSLYIMFRILSDDLSPTQSCLFEYHKGEYQRITLLSKIMSPNGDIEINVIVEENAKPDPTTDLILSDILSLDEPSGFAKWTLIFSSPNPLRYKESMKAPCNYSFTMPTWSEEELEAVNPSKNIWYNRFVRFGGVPCYVLWDGIGQDPERKLTKALNDKEKGGKLVQNFFNFDFGAIDVDDNDLLVHVNPPWNLEKNDWDYHEEWVYNFASDEIFCALTRGCKESVFTAAIEYFNGGVALKTNKQL